MDSIVQREEGNVIYIEVEPIQKPKPFAERFFTSHQLPFSFKNRQAILVLDAHMPDTGVIPDENLYLFSRDLLSYKTGDIVARACGSFGNDEVLRERYFRIGETHFVSDGRAIAVMLESTCEEKIKILVPPAYFSGWLNIDAIKLYESNLV